VIFSHMDATHAHDTGKEASVQPKALTNTPDRMLNPPERLLPIPRSKEANLGFFAYVWGPWGHKIRSLKGLPNVDDSFVERKESKDARVRLS
jgi:hypothetical protein